MHQNSGERRLGLVKLHHNAPEKVLQHPYQLDVIFFFKLCDGLEFGNLV